MTSKLFIQTLAIVAVWCSLGCLFADALACSAQYQCSSVTTNYNYVTCIDGSCACLTNQGFTGAATTSSPCTCASPNSVTWEGSQPYCLNIATATLQSVQIERTQTLVNQVKRVYSNLIYPTPYLVLNGSVSLDDIFDPSAVGRVDPLGTFDDRQVLIEYYYVFAIAAGVQVPSVDYVDIFGVGDEVFVRVNVLFGSQYYGEWFYQNVTESGRYLFASDSDLIISADIIIHNMGEATAASVADPAAFIDEMCTELTVNPGTCPEKYDPAGYYTSYEDCVNFMTNTVRFGTYDQAASNSTVCRRVHTTLSHYDPATHCPHAGKTGGGKCIDTPYQDYYLVSY